MAVEGGQGHVRLFDDPTNADGVDALAVEDPRAAVSSRRSRAAEFLAGGRSVIFIAGRL
jgi:hypothetical protein